MCLCLWLHKTIPYCLAQLYTGELHLNSPIKELLLYSNIKKDHLWVSNIYLNIILTICWVEKSSSLGNRKGALSMRSSKSPSIFFRYFLGGSFGKEGVWLARPCKKLLICLFLWSYWCIILTTFKWVNCGIWTNQNERANTPSFHILHAG